MSDDAEIDFFGAHIKVKSAKLAALLNSAVTDDVAVFGRRAIDLVGIEPRGERPRDDELGDEDLSAVCDGAPAPRAGLVAMDDSHDSLDRMFARPWAPPAQR